MESPCWGKEVRKKLCNAGFHNGDQALLRNCSAGKIIGNVTIMCSWRYECQHIIISFKAGTGSTTTYCCDPFMGQPLP